MANAKNIEIFRGDDETFDITIKDSDGNAVDISGYKFWITVKHKATDADADAVIGPKTGSVTNAANGEAQIPLTNSETDVDAVKYIYDIQQKDASNKITTLVSGEFRVLEDVTKTTT